jgi:murein DD-endopeptidase MepM/ murein hydrolase activator NlpD
MMLVAVAAATAALAGSSLAARVRAQAATPPAGAAAAPAESPALRISLSGASVEPGGVTVLTLHAPTRLARAAARVFEMDVPLDPADAPGTWQALIGIDLDVKAGLYPVSVTAIDGVSERSSVVDAQLWVRPRQFPTRRLRVAPRYVDPPAGEVTRILAEAQRLTDVFASRTPRQWRGPFTAPAPGTPNSNFGLRSVFNGQARNPHAGVDYRGPTGQPIAAPGGGTVVLAEDLYFTGRTVVVDHGAGLFSLFAHLSRIDVAPGQRVAQADTIGALGATGRVTGPHLHWAMRLGGARVDPLAVVAALRTAP